MEAYTKYPAEECTTPLGFPVEPEVYRIKRGSSAFIFSTGQSFDATAINSS